MIREQLKLMMVSSRETFALVFSPKVIDVAEVPLLQTQLHLLPLSPNINHNHRHETGKGPEQVREEDSAKASLKRCRLCATNTLPVRTTGSFRQRTTTAKSLPASLSPSQCSQNIARMQ